MSARRADRLAQRSGGGSILRETGAQGEVFELQGVAKHFGAQQALRALDLRIPSGRTTVLIGPSGCGKSTLLRILVGLVRPDRGTVRFEGERLTPDNVVALRRRMGYVIQEGGLFPHLTAGGNAALMADYLGWPAARIRERLEALCALTRFPPGGLERYPAQLSGGQRQRVSLMRALMLDPDVLLLDEPLGALDPMIRADLQADLRDVFRTLRKSVVMVTHDLAEAAFFAGRVILMRGGTVVQQGALRELLRAPADAFVKRFVRAQRASLAALEDAP